jgi:hypothetical protein
MTCPPLRKPLTMRRFNAVTFNDLSSPLLLPAFGVRRSAFALRMGAWSFSGAWMLELGASRRALGIPPNDLP